MEAYKFSDCPIFGSGELWLTKTVAQPCNNYIGDDLI